jgi:hypothetical protein
MRFRSLNVLKQDLNNQTWRLSSKKEVVPILAAAKRVWGQDGVIQRCQVHKKRNVRAHVPENYDAEFERRLSGA